MPTPSFWRRTPPAVFPALFGALGLGLAWRRAGGMVEFAGGVSELILGAATLIYVGAALAYAVKFMLRPAVILEDLKILPGRAGLAAMSLSTLLLAAVFVRYSDGLATLLLFFGLGLHAMLAALVIWTLATGPKEMRQITPAWHLAFVGFIVAPLSATPLGYGTISGAILGGTITIAALIYGVSLAQMLRQPPPPPLRPLLAIHLAPFSLFGTAAAQLGLWQLAWIMACLAIFAAMALLIRARWLTQAGFSPLWGAFTFPLAAFSGLMFVMGSQSIAFAIIGALSLAGATILIRYVVARVLQLWAKGTLASTTNAAVA